MNRRCYIAGAGEFCDSCLPCAGDYIIAADGGLAALTVRGIEADMVVGDFDSFGAVPVHPNVMQTPAIKDDTDTMLAVRLGLEQGFRAFMINGGLGGRIDHTLANVQALAYIAESGARGYLAGDGHTITVIRDSIIRLRGVAGKYVSVFCHGDRAEGVDLRGLRYPLTDATLTSSFPLGTSNEFTDEDAHISVRSGALVVVWHGGADCIID